MSEFLNESSFKNAKSVEKRIAEMLKDGNLTPEERTEILWVWHEFRKSKDGTILKAREQLREFAIKNWYEWLARRLYTDSWTWSHNETPEKENKRLSKARNRRDNAKSIIDLDTKILTLEAQLEQLNIALEKKNKTLMQTNNRLTKAEEAKNWISKNEVREKEDALLEATSELSEKETLLNWAKELLKTKQEEYNTATDKAPLEEWLKNTLSSVNEAQKEYNLALLKKEQAQTTYTEAFNTKMKIFSEFNKAKLENETARNDLETTMKIQENAEDMLKKAKEWKTQAQAKEKKSETNEISDAEIKDKEQVELQVKRDKEKKKAEEATQE